jgi:glycosyltransferase involved in cell wall biosynthesis
MNNISFFIPAYNCATTIAESVHSIMVSNFNEGDELIITNDSSTDDTASVLSALQTDYPVIKVITHKRNKGGAAARNTCIENASNELLFCLDADNVLEKNSIKPLADFMEKNQADVASFKEIRYFAKTTDVIDEIWSFNTGLFTIQNLFTGALSPGASGNYLFTKTSWLKADEYSEDLGALDTWSFGFKQLMAACTMVVMPDSYYFHRRGHDSYYITDAWSRRKSVSLRLIKLMINYIDQIHPDDIDYMFSKKGRYTWFNNLEKHPIRLVNKTDAQKIWANDDLKNSLGKKIMHRSNHYKKRLIQILTSKIRK